MTKKQKQDNPEFISLEESTSLKKGTRVTFIPGLQAMYAEALKNICYVKKIPLIRVLHPLMGTDKETGQDRQAKLYELTSQTSLPTMFHDEERPRNVWIEQLALEAVSSKWPDLDMEGRARALSHLMRPALSRSTPSTARMEELGWHRVIGPNWDSDLASEILRAARLWKQGSANLAAHSLVDSLLGTGRSPKSE